MKSTLPGAPALALFMAALLPFSVFADSQDAFCEVREHGEKDGNASGYCTLSQRQGAIGIRLANGDSFDLEPGEHAGRYLDQHGNGVERTVKPDGSHYYEWEQRNITVYFNRDEGHYY